MLQSSDPAPMFDRSWKLKPVVCRGDFTFCIKHMGSVGHGFCSYYATLYKNICTEQVNWEKMTNLLSERSVK